VFSIPDMALLGAAALMLFGPDQLPRVARKAGNVMREIQNTSQSFIREMERAADVQDAATAKPYEPAPYDPLPYEPAPYDDAPTTAMHAVEPPAPDPDAPEAVGEKLAEPRPALGLGRPERPSYDTPAQPTPALRHIFGGPDGSAPAEPPPQSDHAPHL
jgi:sec-independent protein translocase protein TatA